MRTQDTVNAMHASHPPNRHHPETPRCNPFPQRSSPRESPTHRQLKVPSCTAKQRLQPVKRAPRLGQRVHGRRPLVVQLLGQLNSQAALHRAVSWGCSARHRMRRGCSTARCLSLGGSAGWERL